MPFSSRVNRLFGAVLTAVVLYFGTAGLCAPVAEAATSISFCFKWSTNTPYANQPIFMRSIANTAIIKASKTNARGCATWTTPTYGGVYVQAYARLNAGSHYELWSGNTPHYTQAGSGVNNLGTGSVSRVG